MESNLKIRELEERIQALEKELERAHEKEELLKMAFIETDQGIWEWDQKNNLTKIDDCETVLLKRLGYSPDALNYNLDWWNDNLHPEDKRVYKNALTRYCSGESDFFEMEYRLKTKSGDWSWFWARGICTDYDKNGMPLRMIGSYRNIDSQKKVEEKLLAMNERYQALFQRSFDIVFIADLKGTLMDFNQAALDLFGFSREEIIGKNLFEMLDPSQVNTALETQRQIAETGAQKRLTEFWLNDRSGNIVWLETKGSLIYKNGKPYALQSIARDITKRKETEEQLKKAHSELEMKVAERTKQLSLVNEYLKQEVVRRKEIEEKLIMAKRQAEIANQAKSEFLANISHEIRTPMHHILNYSKFGSQKTDKPIGKLRHYFSQIYKTGQRLLVLLNDLLDLSKLESGTVEYKFGRENVRELVIDAANDFDSLLIEKSLDLYITETSVLTELICDGYKIGQVIRNLLDNAIKYSPEGKRVSVTFGAGKLNHHDTDEPALQVSVIDEGIGIPDDEIESIFDKFVQGSKTKSGAGGTGLGLSICRRIVSDHGGKIWAENGPEAGVIFSILLPYRQKDIQRASKIPPKIKLSVQRD